jgi:predicted DNA-binding protein YlxM (UPF0122 family)
MIASQTRKSGIDEILDDIGVTRSEARIAARKRFIQQMNTSRYAEIEKFPVETFLKSFTGNIANLDKQHDEYVQNLDVRKCINLWRTTGKTRNKRFKAYILRQLARGENISLEITGMTGSGKTRVAFGILLMCCMILHKNPRIFLDPDDLDATHLNSCKEFILNAEWTEFTNIYITYSFSQTRRIIAKRMKPGDFCLEDEWQQIFGKGSKTEYAFLCNILNVSARKHGLSAIFISPDLIKVKQIHYVIDCMAMDTSIFKTMAILSFMRKNSDDIVRAGVVIIDVKLLDEIWDFYDTNSADIKARVQALGGGAAVGAEDIEKMAWKLVDLYDAQPDELMKQFYLDKSKNIESLGRTDEEIASCTVVFEDICALALFIIENPDLAERPGGKVVNDDDAHLTPLSDMIRVHDDEIRQMQISERMRRKSNRGTIAAFGMYSADPAGLLDKIALQIARLERKKRQAIDESIKQCMHALFDIELEEEHGPVSGPVYLPKDFLFPEEQVVFDNLRAKKYDIEPADAKLLASGEIGLYEIEKISRRHKIKAEIDAIIKWEHERTIGPEESWKYTKLWCALRHMSEAELRGWQIMEKLQPTYPNPLTRGLSPAGITLKSVIHQFIEDFCTYISKERESVDTIKVLDQPKTRMCRELPNVESSDERFDMRSEPTILDEDVEKEPIKREPKRANVEPVENGNWKPDFQKLADEVNSRDVEIWKRYNIKGETQVSIAGDSNIDVERSTISDCVKRVGNKIAEHFEIATRDDMEKAWKIANDPSWEFVSVVHIGGSGKRRSRTSR